MTNPAGTRPMRKTHHALGTRIVLTVYRNDDLPQLNAAVHMIDRYEDKLTVNRDESEVMDVNHAAGVKAVRVPSDTYALIKRAVVESRAGYGFNSLIGPLVKLWKIGFKGANVPSDANIQERLQLIDPQQVELDDQRQTVFLQQRGMELDLGGIAKGWIADRIRDMWTAAGVPAGIIDLGGNLLFVGRSPRRSDGRWVIGVQDPQKKRGQDALTVVKPTCSAVTSGIYERFLIVNGHRYHHLIDPRTGYPLKTKLSGVTVFTAKSIDGELEAKRLFFHGSPIEGWRSQAGHLGACFIFQDGHHLLI